MEDTYQEMMDDLRKWKSSQDSYQDTGGSRTGNNGQYEPWGGGVPSPKKLSFEGESLLDTL